MELPAGERGTHKFPTNIKFAGAAYSKRILPILTTQQHPRCDFQNLAIQTGRLGPFLGPIGMTGLLEAPISGATLLLSDWKSKDSSRNFFKSQVKKRWAC